jgi:hypothetical protein
MTYPPLKWVVPLKGPHKDKLGAIVNHDSPIFSTRVVKWATGVVDTTKPFPKLTSKITAVNLRPATDAEVEAHLQKHPDDIWQIIQFDEYMKLPTRTRFGMFDAAGVMEYWPCNPSLKHRGKMELFDPWGKLVGVFDKASDAEAVVDKHYRDQGLF